MQQLLHLFLPKATDFLLLVRDPVRQLLCTYFILYNTLHYNQCLDIWGIRFASELIMLTRTTKVEDFQLPRARQSIN